MQKSLVLQKAMPSGGLEISQKDVFPTQTELKTVNYCHLFSYDNIFLYPMQNEVNNHFPSLGW